MAAGHARVLTDGEPRADMGPGDSFGEIALLRNVARTASVVAIGSVEAFALGRDAFVRAVSGGQRSRNAAEAVMRERLAAR